MELTYAPKGRLQIDNARITHRNFSGTPSQFNREGDRNFSLVIDTLDKAEALLDAGWNVKIKQPLEEGDTPFMYLPVKIKFNDYGPNVYLVSGNKKTRLDEETVDCLDRIDFDKIDMDIRPYDWEFNGKEGRTAYLENIQIVQRLDRFADNDFPTIQDDPNLPF